MVFVVKGAIMSFPHLPAFRGAIPVPKPRHAGPAARDTLAGPRPVLRTRRYEIAYLSDTGAVETTTRLAPATPDFEEAFSAFARGTLIQTEGGLVAIEDLLPGMRVVTAGGSAETVVWTGTMTAYPAGTIPQGEPFVLTRITADALGLGRPMPDLVLGPRARILMRDQRTRAAAGAAGAFVPARSFIDGDQVIEVNPVAPVAVFHFALARHAAVRAAGLEIEAYHPGASGPAAGRDPQMAALFASLFPHLARPGDFGPLAYPRLSESEVDGIRAA